MASYLERVRSWKLIIREWRAKSGNPWKRRDPRSETGALFQDHEDPRAEIFASSVDIILQIDNIHLTADDKNETELAMCLSGQ